MTDVDVSTSAADDRPPRPRARLAGRTRVIVVGVLLAGALVVLATNLGEATTYFKTADEAVRDRAQLDDRRFRIQGTVVPGSLQTSGDRSEFSIESNGVDVDVVHRGDPPELFKEGIGVVLEGRWDGRTYSSDKILVRHSSEYKAENPDRIPDGQPE